MWSSWVLQPGHWSVLEDAVALHLAERCHSKMQTSLDGVERLELQVANLLRLGSWQSSLSKSKNSEQQNRLLSEHWTEKPTKVKFAFIPKKRFFF